MKKGEKLTIVGLPKKIGIYEALKTITVLIVLEIFLYVISIYINIINAKMIILCLQIVIPLLGIAEIILTFIRLLRYTKISVFDNCVIIESGRWISVKSVVQRALIISVEVSQGPISKSLKIGNVTVNAIGKPPDIPPMSINVAKEFQRVVMNGFKHDGV